MLKLAINIDSFSKELSPSIGFGSESIESVDNTNSETTTLDNSFWTIGFEGRF